MRRSIVLSAVLHLAILVLVIVGLPRWQKPIEVAPAIPVEVVTLSDKSAAPKAEPKPEPVKLEPPKAEPPPPAPAPPPSPPPAAEPVPEPEPAPQEVAALPPEPEPEPVPLPEPEPKPKPEVKEPEPPKPVVKPKPPAPKPKQVAKKPEEKKPEEPQKLSFLKTVEKLRQTTETAKAEPQEPQPQPQPVAPPSSVEDQLARNELSEMIRRKVEGCWNVPAGAREAEDLLVEIKVVLNRDGSVIRADIVDSARATTDTFYRAAAESARRAVQICSPFSELPADRYDIWQTLTLRFNPRELLGT
ncbi:MAG TPA: energy transducer TonB [Alphaproteobacteria bacterium]|nr:energy transducer TonB [Alphaproteobacteria bacterium]